ncbi:hypothetical protein PR048_021243 [Dryococelus australis]|uniref:Uncharacterized protein n=1 Tax=Dryococelus australis TaxID=614101 RepID=A0ABQ9GXN0_9NEOP|nr:hypothetical protein PR048_021243 [Dryococelus australis]
MKHEFYIGEPPRGAEMSLLGVVCSRVLDWIELLDVHLSESRDTGSLLEELTKTHPVNSILNPINSVLTLLSSRIMALADDRFLMASKYVNTARTKTNQRAVPAKRLVTTRATSGREVCGLRASVRWRVKLAGGCIQLYAIHGKKDYPESAVDWAPGLWWKLGCAVDAGRQTYMSRTRFEGVGGGVYNCEGAGLTVERRGVVCRQRPRLWADRPSCWVRPAASSSCAWRVGNQHDAPPAIYAARLTARALPAHRDIYLLALTLASAEGTFHAGKPQAQNSSTGDPVTGIRFFCRLFAQDTELRCSLIVVAYEAFSGDIVNTTARAVTKISLRADRAVPAHKRRHLARRAAGTYGAHSHTFNPDHAAPQDELEHGYETAIFSANSSRTRRQNGAAGQQNIGKPFANQRQVTYLSARSNQLFKKSPFAEPRASQTANGYKNVGAGVAERLACSLHAKAIRVQSLTGFTHLGIVPDDAVGRRVFSGSPVSPPFNSGAAPYLNNPHRLSRPRYFITLTTSLRAAMVWSDSSTRLPPRRTGFDSRRGVAPGFPHVWKSYWTTPLVGGFSRGTPVPPPRPFIPALLRSRLSSPSSALNTSIGFRLMKSPRRESGLECASKLHVSHSPCPNIICLIRQSAVAYQLTFGERFFTDSCHRFGFSVSGFYSPDLHLCYKEPPTGFTMTATLPEGENPKKTRRQTASSGTIPKRENHPERKSSGGGTPPGIEPGSPWREASSLTTKPSRPRFRKREDPGATNDGQLAGGGRRRPGWRPAPLASQAALLGLRRRRRRRLLLLEALLVVVELLHDACQLHLDAVQLRLQAAVRHLELVPLLQPLGAAVLRVAAVLERAPLLLQPHHLLAREPVQLLVELAHRQRHERVVVEDVVDGAAVVGQGREDGPAAAAERPLEERRASWAPAAHASQRVVVHVVGGGGQQLAAPPAVGDDGGVLRPDVGRVGAAVRPQVQRLLAAVAQRVGEPAHVAVDDAGRHLDAAPGDGGDVRVVVHVGAGRQVRRVADGRRVWRGARVAAHQRHKASATAGARRLHNDARVHLVVVSGGLLSRRRQQVLRRVVVVVRQDVAASRRQHERWQTLRGRRRRRPRARHQPLRPRARLPLHRVLQMVQHELLDVLVRQVVIVVRLHGNTVSLSTKDAVTSPQFTNAHTPSGLGESSHHHPRGSRGVNKHRLDPDRDSVSPGEAHAHPSRGADGREMPVLVNAPVQAQRLTMGGGGRRAPPRHAHQPPAHWCPRRCRSVRPRPSRAHLLLSLPYAEHNPFLSLCRWNTRFLRLLCSRRFYLQRSARIISPNMLGAFHYRRLKIGSLAESVLEYCL